MQFAQLLTSTSRVRLRKRNIISIHFIAAKENVPAALVILANRCGTNGAVGALLWWNDGARVRTGLDNSLLTSKRRRCDRHMRDRGKDEKEQGDASKEIHLDQVILGIDEYNACF